MLENQNILPITGTFVNMLIPDTGITNNGLKDWEKDFQFLKAIGMELLLLYIFLITQGQSMVYGLLRALRSFQGFHETQNYFSKY